MMHEFGLKEEIFFGQLCTLLVVLLEVSSRFSFMLVLSNDLRVKCSPVFSGVVSHASIQFHSTVDTVSHPPLQCAQHSEGGGAETQVCRWVCAVFVLGLTQIAPLPTPTVGDDCGFITHTNYHRSSYNAGRI